MKWSYLLIVVVIQSVPSYSFSQNRMDLGDIDIKGELHNDDRLRMISREPNSLRNHVKFRTNFRKEIVQNLPQVRR